MFGITLTPPRATRPHEVSAHRSRRSTTPARVTAGGRRLKRGFLAACGSLLAAAALASAVAPAAHADSSSCGDGYMCVWNGAYYDGAMRQFGAGDAGRAITFENSKFSLKNHYTNRAVWSWNGTTLYPNNCLPAGTKLAWPFVRSVAIYIGASGSHC